MPSNCELAIPPLVNQQIWKILDKTAHKNDKIMVDIQNLIAAGFGPVIRLAELMKNHLTPEAKTLLSDIMTILGQTRYNLSLRCRYLIRPSLKKKYSSLCNLSTPISKNLFGDNIDKEIKSCDTQYSLGKDTFTQRDGFRAMALFY